MQNETTIDGPGLVAWIETEEGGEITSAEQRLGFHARRIREWREGVDATLGTADVVLTKLGLHLGHVPGDLFADSREGLLSAA